MVILSLIVKDDNSNGAPLFGELEPDIEGT
jgi:hypothetical protein